MEPQPTTNSGESDPIIGFLDAIRQRLATPNGTLDIERAGQAFEFVARDTSPFDGRGYVAPLHAERAFDDPIDTVYAYCSDYVDSTIDLYTAPHPEGPWAHYGTVVEPLTEGDRIDKPSVVYDPHEREVKLWYNSMDAPTKLAHHPVLARSPASGDGADWSDQTILSDLDYPSGRAGRWDTFGLNSFSVVRQGQTFYAAYMSSDRYGRNEGQMGIGLATSRDGVHWKRPIHPFGWGDIWETWDLETRPNYGPALHRFGNTLWITVSGTDAQPDGIFALPAEWYDRDLAPEDKRLFLKPDEGGEYPHRASLNDGHKTYFYGNNSIGCIDWLEVSK